MTPKALLVVGALLAVLAPVRAKDDLCAAANATCSGFLEIMILLDGSGSMSAADYSDARDFSKTLVSNFDLGDTLTRFGVIQFAGSTPTLQEALSAASEDICDAVDLAQQGGGTPMADALAVAQQELSDDARAGVPQVIFLVTDGENSDGAQEVLDIAAEVKNNGTDIYALAIGDNIDFDTLNKSVSYPPQNFLFTVDQASDLLDVVDTLVSESCLYVSGVSPQGGCSYGGDTVVVVGTGFLFGVDYACRFGSLPIVPATRLSSQLLACVAPSSDGFVGSVPLDVSPNGGLTFSATSAAYRYENCGDGSNIAWVFALLFVLMAALVAAGQYLLKYKLISFERVTLAEPVVETPYAPLVEEPRADPVTSNQQYLWAGTGGSGISPLNVQWGKFGYAGQPEPQKTSRLSIKAKEVEQTRGWVKIAQVGAGVLSAIFFIIMLVLLSE